MSSGREAPPPTPHPPHRLAEVDATLQNLEALHNEQAGDDGVGRRDRRNDVASHRCNETSSWKRDSQSITDNNVPFFLNSEFICNVVPVGKQ